jgi:hypothetical protein
VAVFENKSKPKFLIKASQNMTCFLFFSYVCDKKLIKGEMQFADIKNIGEILYVTLCFKTPPNILP